MNITVDDITDPQFQKCSDARKSAYVAAANLRFDSICQTHGIDQAQIPETRPYVPLRTAVVCALIAMCTDTIGADWQQAQAGVNVDQSLSKRKELLSELDQLLSDMTPVNCGYDPDPDDNEDDTIGCIVHVRRA